MNNNVEIYIREKETRKRESLLERLKSKGYSIDTEEIRGDEVIIESILPIIVDMTGKTYRMMGNVTCAAGATAKGQVITLEEFYERYSIMDIDSD